MKFKVRWYEKAVIIEKFNSWLVCSKTEQSIKVIEPTKDYLNASQECGCFGIGAVLNIVSLTLLVIVTKAHVVCRIWDRIVYIIQEIEFVKTYDDRMPSLSDQEHLRNFMAGAKRMLIGSYFSYEYDLTNTVRSNQHYFFDSISFKRLDSRFLINHFGLKDLNIETIEFCLFVTKGFTSCVEIEKDTQMVLFARLSRWNCGTRYNTRGCDSKGNAGSFYETEFAILKEDTVASFVQVRGSVPLSWNQNNSMRCINIKADSKEWSQRHFDVLRKHYGEPTVVVDLLNDFGSESLLSFGYEELGINRHIRCSINSKPTELLKLSRKAVGYIGFYSGKIERHLRLHEIISVQSGVIRSNCLDCLDRTNMSQCLQTEVLLEQMLIAVGTKVNLEIVGKLRSMWAECGDVISLFSTGTPCKTSKKITRFTNGIIDWTTDAILSPSVKWTSKFQNKRIDFYRFYYNSIIDPMKQQEIDAFLGLAHHRQLFSITRNGIRSAILEWIYRISPEPESSQWMFPFLLWSLFFQVLQNLL